MQVVDMEPKGISDKTLNTVQIFNHCLNVLVNKNLHSLACYQRHHFM